MCACVRCPYPVLEAGHGEVQQVQQAVDLHHRQVRHPLLQEARVSVLQHPQEAHQQGAAALRRQGAGLAPGLAVAAVVAVVGVVVVDRGGHTHTRIRATSNPFTTGLTQTPEPQRYTKPSPRFVAYLFFNRETQSKGPLTSGL